MSIVVRCFGRFAQWKPRLAGIVVFAILVGLAGLRYAPLSTYREVPSPGGEFIAVGKTSMFYTMVPMMPGQAGDKPGRVTIFRMDGRSCGSAAVDTVSAVTDVRWRLDVNPREASFIGMAAWNLDTCSLEARGR